MKIYKIAQQAQPNAQNPQNPEQMQEAQEAMANLQLGLVAVNDMVQRLETSGLKQEIIDILSGRAMNVISSGNATKFTGADLQTAATDINQMISSMGLIGQAIQVIKTTMPENISDVTKIIQRTTPDKFTQQMAQYFTSLGPRMNVSL